VDEHVGAAKEFRHPIGEREHAHPRLIRISAREILRGADVATREHDHMAGTRRQGRIGAVGERADAPPATGHDHERLARADAETRPHRVSVLGCDEPRGDERMTRDHASATDVAPHPRQRDRMHDDVPVGAAVAPHRVVGQIKDQRTEGGVELAVHSHPGEGRGQRRMSADDNVRGMVADELAEPPSPGQVEQLPTGGLQRPNSPARLIGEVVGPRCHRKLTSVSVADDVLSRRSEQCQSVAHVCLDVVVSGKLLAERATGRHVPVPDVSGEDQDTSGRGRRSHAPHREPS
jgi:hypothetical protein